MKSIKIMLTAIAVFAVVGAALAFKAKKFQGICYYSSTTVTTGACPFQGRGTTIVAVGNQTYATTALPIANVCPVGPSCDILRSTGDQPAD